MQGVLFVLGRYYLLKKQPKKKKVILISLTQFLENNIHLKLGEYQKNISNI
jgi:hypothetical protein